MFYEEPITGQVIISVLTNMLTISMICWTIHMAITRFNMFLTEAEILRNGNEGLLNSLEEGLII